MLPSFELHGDVERYRRQDDRAPFPHVLRAYSLVRTDRKAAASEFATAAAKLSAGFDTYSYGYRGPFLMIAGHLMEFEARHGSPTSRVQSARAAVDYYRAALRELTTIENVPYPYLISYARALAMAGQAGPANELAGRLYRRVAGDRVSRAAQTYDLASVHALSYSAVSPSAMNAPIATVPGRGAERPPWGTADALRGWSVPLMAMTSMMTTNRAAPGGAIARGGCRASATNRVRPRLFGSHGRASRPTHVGLMPASSARHRTPHTSNLRHPRRGAASDAREH